MSGALRIDRLGARGDGIADTEGGPVFVPFALPGEKVTAALERDRGTLMAVVEASPLRVEPACRHFAECGGCALQHLEVGAYRAFKRNLVVEALSRRGFADAEKLVGELVPCRPESRRRVALTARRTERGMLLGFNRMMSATIIDIGECPVAVPEIVTALPALREIAGKMAGTANPFRVTVTATDSGLDVAVEGGGALSDRERREAADLAMRLGFARLSTDGEIVIEPRKPMVRFGDVAVHPPPAAFLQATVDAEAAMAELVSTHLAGARRIADLFSGCGSFALRLASRAEVHAVEADAAALAALDRGYRFASGLKRVTHERRDLFRRPLTAKELARFDGLVFDPPRAGAEAQARQIAASQVARVAAVSCNPATLARDLRFLADGGYELLEVVPIDQFLWSAHVEAVALLEGPAVRRKGPARRTR